MRKIKDAILFLFVIAILSLSINALEFQGWEPTGLREIELKFHELKTQANTLDLFAPEKFPDFKELEKTNQLVEQLDFNKRKFDLLIAVYNQLEDKLFPFFLNYSKAHPELETQINARVKLYTGDQENSIIHIQEKINYVALQIDRLEKRIERVHLNNRIKELSKDGKQNAGENKQSQPIASRIRQLEEENNNYTSKNHEEEIKLEELKKKEAKAVAKIAEKGNEIIELEKKANASSDSVEKLLLLAFTDVRKSRLNGLEIPRLNALKTFVYLSENNIETFKQKIKNIQEEIASLEKLQTKERLDKFIKSLWVLGCAALAIFLLIALTGKTGKKIVGKVTQSDKLEPQRKQRYHTLSAIIISLIKVGIWVMVILWVFRELEIDYGPFLVAAGGISLAVGFGAQSLVKDVVTGFFLLMEEQFALGDFIEINGKTGTVEKISLRTIKFRSLDGTLNIIPNGNINNVSNKTYQWSRAVVKFGVAYEQPPEKVMEILKDVCREMEADPQWKCVLIEEPVPQGIISFGDSAAEFRVLAKTRPGDQWAVERELHIRIKNAFDRHGVDIPYNSINIIDRTSKKENDFNKSL
ncbi:MAG: mechanosensitive ion channel family protein [Acidobacteria bacterium]|jgi:small conductance mechanosensitive channel|nr:mechanosensitive ion channel family protein [Acidobacteriota bacterium]